MTRESSGTFKGLQLIHEQWENVGEVRKKGGAEGNHYLTFHDDMLCQVINGGKGKVMTGSQVLGTDLRWPLGGAARGSTSQIQVPVTYSGPEIWCGTSLVNTGGLFTVPARLAGVSNCRERIRHRRPISVLAFPSDTVILHLDSLINMK